MKYRYPIIKAVGHYHTILAAATASGKATQATALQTAGSCAGIVHPDCARNVVITTDDDTGDNLAGSVIVTGTDVAGNTISETVAIVAAADSHATTKVFATIASITYNFGATGAAADTLDIGYGVIIGLPTSASNVSIFRVAVDEVPEAVATFSSTLNAFTTTTAPNGTRAFDIYYRYEL